MNFQLHINKVIRATVLVIIAAVALVSCGAPIVSDEFRAISERDSLGRFAFDLDMSDSLVKYDIAFYTRIDSGEKSFSQMTDIPINVEFTAPSGEVYSEDIYWPKSSFNTERMGTYDSCVDYRVSCEPVEYGIWKMCLTVAPVRGLCGVGVILSSKK